MKGNKMKVNKTKENMNDIEKQVLTKVESVLGALKLQYAIIDSTGKKHGSLNVASDKKPKRAFKYKWGALSGYIRPLLSDLPVNTSKEIPIGVFDAENVRIAISNHALKNWGKSSYSTTVKKNSVQVTRLDPTVSQFLKEKDAIQQVLADWK